MSSAAMLRCRQVGIKRRHRRSQLPQAILAQWRKQRIGSERIPGLAKLFDSAMTLGKLAGDKMAAGDLDLHCGPRVAAAATNRSTRGSIIRTVSPRSELAGRGPPTAVRVSCIMALNL